MYKEEEQFVIDPDLEDFLLCPAEITDFVQDLCRHIKETKEEN